MNTEPVRPAGERAGRSLTAWGHRVSRRLRDWQRADRRNRSLLIALLMGFGVIYLIILFLTF